MLMKIFAIRDNKVGAYSKPFIEDNAIQASRALHMAVNDKMIQLSQFPEDFDLYELGEIDNISGALVDPGRPKFIVSAISLKLPEENKLIIQTEQKNGPTN
jgi:hypothetical protein|nr:MAG: nonstructural protein [Microviridae sp.]